MDFEETSMDLFEEKTRTSFKSRNSNISEWECFNSRTNQQKDTF